MEVPTWVPQRIPPRKTSGFFKDPPLDSLFGGPAPWILYRLLLALKAPLNKESLKRETPGSPSPWAFQKHTILNEALSHSWSGALGRPLMVPRRLPPRSLEALLGLAPYKALKETYKAL